MSDIIYGSAGSSSAAAQVRGKALRRYYNALWQTFTGNDPTSTFHRNLLKNLRWKWRMPDGAFVTERADGKLVVFAAEAAISARRRQDEARAAEFIPVIIPPIPEFPVHPDAVENRIGPNRFRFGDILEAFTYEWTNQAFDANSLFETVSYEAALFQNDQDDLNNLFPNPSFENSNTETGWTEDHATTGVYCGSRDEPSTITNKVVGGKNSMYLAGNSAAARRYIEGALTVGTTYRLTFWLYTPGEITFPVILDLGTSANDRTSYVNGAYANMIANNGSPAFTRQTVVFTATSANLCVSLRTAGFNQSNVYKYVDNFDLRATTLGTGVKTKIWEDPFRINNSPVANMHISLFVTPRAEALPYAAGLTNSEGKVTFNVNAGVTYYVYRLWGGADLDVMSFVVPV